MTRDIKDIITDMREIVKPRIAKMLLEANFEGCGKEDKAEFETEFEMLLTFAERGVTVEPQEKTGHWEKIMQEIVIKIPNEAKQAFDNAENNELKVGFYDHGGVIASAIRNGKVLPPGHGELRDTTTIVYKLADADVYLTDKDWNEIGKALQSAEVLVEADKEK